MFSKEYSFIYILFTICLLVSCNSNPKVTENANTSDKEIITIAGIGSSSYADKTGSLVMGYDELLECGLLKKNIRDDSLSLEIANSNLEKTRLNLNNEGDQLEVDRYEVDTTDKNAVENFNNRIAKLRSSTKQFNSDVDAYNSQIPAFNEKTGSFNLKCAGRPFYKNDFESLPVEAQIAMEADMSDYNLPVRHRDSTQGAYKTKDGKIRIGGN